MIDNENKNIKNNNSGNNRSFFNISNWRENIISPSYRIFPRFFLWISKYLLLPSLVILSSIGILHGSIPKAYATGNSLFTLSGSINSYSNFGGTGTNNAQQGFVYIPENSQNVCNFQAYIRKVLSPTDSLQVSLYTSSNNSLTSLSTGSLLQTSASVLGSSFPSGGDTLTSFEFDNCQLLTGGAYYVFLIERTGSYNDTNKYQIAYTTGTPSSTIIRSSVYNSGSWVLDTATRLFVINGFPSLDTVTIPATSTLLDGFYTGMVSSYQDCSVYTGGFFSSSTLGGLYCYGQNFLTWGVNQLFVPSASSTGVTMFRSGLQSFMNVFPFNLFFNFTSAIYGEVSNYTVTDNTITMTLPSPTAGTFTLSSTTLNTYLGSSTWTLIRSYETNIIWTLLALGIIFTLL